MAYFKTNVLDNQIKALPTVSTASGSIATFTTDKAENLVDCEVQIVATGGGGTPTTPIAINGFTGANVTRCGKNLADQTQFVQGSISGTGADTISYTRLRSSFISVKPNTSYAFGTNSTLLVFEIHEYKLDNTWLQYTGINQTSGTITTTANTAYIKILVRNSTNTPLTVDELTTFQMNLGTTPTTYLAYNGSMYNIPFGTTIYGGVLNVGTGVLRVTHGVITDLGALSWTKGSRSFYANITGAKVYAQSVIPNILCEVYRTVSYNDLVSEQYNEVCSINNNFSIILMRDTNYATASDFATAVTGKKAIYELATPTEIQLDSTQIQTLIGKNNIWSDTGDIEVKYILSVGEYVNQNV